MNQIFFSFWVCVLSLSFSLCPALALEDDAVTFIELAPFNNKTSPDWSKVLQDIMNHEAPFDQNNFSDLITLAHETSHGIHAYLRNHFLTKEMRPNGFYVLNNQAVMVEEPGIRKSEVARYVPKSLQGDRYRLYIVGQTAWNDRPLYIWDEWNAYINGGEAGIDLVEKGLWKSGWRDAVAGIVEFVVYSLTTAQAVKDLDPEYFRNYPQFRAFLRWNIERSMKTFKRGSQMTEFKWEKQDRYYLSFIQSEDAESLRNFTRETFGSSWTKEVLGF